jgi:tRNA(Ile2)-agmatinylcytidine synthase
VQLHIGIDDTDSTSGGCTTYLAARIVEQLTRFRVRFLDYPNIIRLLPNIPYKTRGNAAVALRFEAAEAQYASIRELVLNEIERVGRIGEEGTEPATVLLSGKPARSTRMLAERSLCEVVAVRDALHDIIQSGAEAVSYGNNRGLVGALAAIGNTIDRDHTYELIAYRQREYCGTPRKVDKGSVIRMDSLTTPFTYNNYDAKNKRVLVTPHGPDPVLVGIRGETPDSVRRGFDLLTIREPVERWVIFRTNHATDAHLSAARPGIVRPYSAVVLSGAVAEKPRRLEGGHVIFSVRAERGRFTCAAFEPTGRFRDIVSELIPGDEVTVFGGTPGTHGLTVNLEKLSVNRLTDYVTLHNPSCPNCGKNLKSAGFLKGFKCDRCSTVVPDAWKIHRSVVRNIKPGIYLPSAKAQRHLTKPTSRYKREKIWDGKPPSGAWHRP